MLLNCVVVLLNYNFSGSKFAFAVFINSFLKIVCQEVVLESVMERKRDDMVSFVYSITGTGVGCDEDVGLCFDD